MLSVAFEPNVIFQTQQAHTTARESQKRCFQLMPNINSAFHGTNRQNSITLLLLFFFINSLVLINSSLHSPFIGYDAGNHSVNVEKLSRLTWPSKLESSEFFSPPLPYIIPALVYAFFGNIWWAFKIGQFCNVLLSVGTTLSLLMICETISPGKTRLKIFSLGLLGMLPVYYNTFSQVRGEPYLVFLALLTAIVASRIFIFKDFSILNSIWLGLLLGSLVLARQWGFLVFPAIFICGLTMAISDTKYRARIIKTLCLAGGISALVGGSFYFYLFTQYGSVMAFNRKAAIKTSLVSIFGSRDDEKLFSDPIRPNFQRQVIPILYAETWGDYWGYFSYYLIDTRSNTYVKGKEFEFELMEKRTSKWAITNRYSMNSYLGRINLVSLFPSLLLSMGGIYGIYLTIRSFNSVSDPSTVLIGLCSNIIIFSLTGYLWFVSHYRMGGAGDTLKTSYFVQIFPFLAIQTGTLIQKIPSKKLVYFIAVALVIITLHNLPAMFTHVIELPGQGPLQWRFPGR